MDNKKFAGLGTLQAFLDGCKTLFATITHKHTISDITDYTVDSELSSTSANPIQNKTVNDAIDALEIIATGKSDIGHTHDESYDLKGSADNALLSANEYTNEELGVVQDELDKKLSTSGGTVDGNVKVNGELTTISSSSQTYSIGSNGEATMAYDANLCAIVFTFE